jgi:hypothetical protein
VKPSARKKKYDIKLTDIELKFLIKVMYRRCSRYVFLYLRADELGEYSPGRRSAQEAYEKLCELLAAQDLADQILEYYVEAETRRLILPEAEDDPRFTEASQVMRGRLTAPLMAELPEKATYTLWTVSGSWTGALELCGLDPLDGDSRLEAVTRYATANASPKLLSWKFRNRLTPECAGELNKICEAARELGRYPLASEIHRESQQFFHICGLVIWDVLENIGIPATGAPKRNQKVMSGVEGWKVSARRWIFTEYQHRNSPRYPPQAELDPGKRRK